MCFFASQRLTRFFSKKKKINERTKKYKYVKRKNVAYATMLSKQMVNVFHSRGEIDCCNHFLKSFKGLVSINERFFSLLKALGKQVLWLSKRISGADHKLFLTRGNWEKAV